MEQFALCRKRKDSPTPYRSLSGMSPSLVENLFQEEISSEVIIEFYLAGRKKRREKIRTHSNALKEECRTSSIAERGLVSPRVKA